ncbi:Hypothetical predicted protein [Mytilus galloprovincialis]|uniref:Uncharacterized protein n=1 Tax=Mytilus galloprovincialis TaxID=29158 RepID=A0A8B6GW85_MYTGA|nr:Hypothetical predicted protein [Mytilus galloprovincialis]
MVDGQDGHSGRHVAAAVMAVFRPGHVDAITLHLNMQEHVVMGNHHRQNNAKVSLAQKDAKSVNVISVLLFKQLVDGSWGDWSMWKSCNVTCGGGMQLRLRKCDRPVPAFGGLNCSSPDSELQQCNKANCIKVIDGSWSKWTKWTDCTRRCNGGLKERARSCDNPPPINGGSHCNGTSTEADLCNTISCSEVAAIGLTEETEELYIYQASDQPAQVNATFKEDPEELYIYQESDDQPTQAFNNSAYIQDYNSKDVAKTGEDVDPCEIYENFEENCYENF